MSAAIRRALLAVLPIAALAAVPATSAAAVHSSRSHPRRSARWPSQPQPATTSVYGTVGTPATYTVSQLAAQPQSTFTVTSGQGWRSHTTTYTGVNLETLVDASTPTLPATKNALLSVTLGITGAGHQELTLALGELDPSFGNHPAYLAVTANGHTLPAAELVVPGDTSVARTVSDVHGIDVSVDTTAATAPPAAGGLLVTYGSATRFLSAQRLAALPQETLSVSFLAGTATTDATEVGPSLDDVLRAAGIRENLTTSVAAVGDDDYIAAVTPAEQWVGGKQLMISLNENGAALAEPRLVVDGDVKGGRYVSGVYDLVVGGDAGLSWQHPWWTGLGHFHPESHGR